MRTTWRTVCLGIVVSVLGAAPTRAEPEPNSIESLRAAISFLTKTYGKRYPRGNDYLRRLAEIRSNNTAAYAKLDEEKQMVQAMRSGTIVRPGEMQGCIGCHENRQSAPATSSLAPLAMRRPPSRLQPWLDTPSVAEAKPFNYLTDVQPVFDRHCISCHDYGKEAGDVLNLSGDLSYPFNVSYMELMSKSGPRYTGAEEKLVNFVGDGPPGVLPAYAWGSHRSKLVHILKEGHEEVRLTDEELHRIVSWIDVNAVYYGRYESYYPGRNPLLALEDGRAKHEAVFGQYAWRGKINKYVLDRGHLVNFTRPELSPALELIEDTGQRALALSHIKEAATLLAETPREDETNEGVARSEVDTHNAARLARTRAENAKSIEAILKNTNYYQCKEGNLPTE